MDNNQIYVNRIQRVRSAMKERGIEGLWLSKRENQGYVTGFPSSDVFVLLTEQENYLITDFRYIEAVKDACEPLFTVIMTDTGNSLWDVVKKIGVKSMGVEESVLTVSDLKQLQAALPHSTWKDASGLIEEIRIIKDETELAAMERAIALTDRCFSHMLTVLHSGMTEKQGALEIEMFLKSNGAQRLSFPTICVSGARTSLPHGEPSDKEMEPGDFVTMDFGCVVDGYCSDMTRTVAIGHVSEEQKEIYQIVRRAQEAVLQNLKAGIGWAEGDRFARDIIEEAGYGPYFGHGTGHGVGLEIHEAPTMSPRGRGTFREGMTVTVEPGIYLPKKFGVRIEDLAIVTSSGIINKVKSNKELIIL
ncbi:MAG: aminopeptidase P family protein [Firmicutes bacterium]|nr:aminopeptidase P family protein [Bacillota bacterium]